MVGYMWGVAPRCVEGVNGNNRVQQKNTSYLCRIYGEKVAIATKCGLEGVHRVMGLEV